jgi:hypothetical protein
MCENVRTGSGISPPSVHKLYLTHKMRLAYTVVVMVALHLNTRYTSKDTQLSTAVDSVVVYSVVCYVPLLSAVL